MGQHIDIVYIGDCDCFLIHFVKLILGDKGRVLLDLPQVMLSLTPCHDESAVDLNGWADERELELLRA